MRTVGGIIKPTVGLFVESIPNKGLPVNRKMHKHEALLKSVMIL
jgi:hypothetical protein